VAAVAVKQLLLLSLGREHVARGVLELMKVSVEVHTREFVDRVM
jgi:hypothetical protein